MEKGKGEQSKGGGTCRGGLIEKPRFEGRESETLASGRTLEPGTAGEALRRAAPDPGTARRPEWLGQSAGVREGQILQSFYSVGNGSCSRNWSRG